MLRHLLLILFFFFTLHSIGQTDSFTSKGNSANRELPKTKDKPETTQIQTDKQSIMNDSAELAADDSAKIAEMDSLKDSTNFVQVPVIRDTVKPLSWQNDDLLTNLFKMALKAKDSNQIFLIQDERQGRSKDILFYALVGLFLFLGLIKTAFSKYFQNIFSSFFSTSFRQKHYRGDLFQNNLPSLLTNILFFLSGGLFVALIFVKQKWITIPFWWLYLYSACLLAAIYIGKFIVISLTGWIFKVRETAKTYVFIVFLVNKIAGIVILPLILFLAFANGEEVGIATTTGVVVLILLLLYRYIMMLSFLKYKSRVSPFHFFVYLCCVEILPMLVIFKVLFNKINIVF